MSDEQPPPRSAARAIGYDEGRLGEFFDELFSPEIKIPSLKFAMLASYGAFLLLCALSALLKGSGVSRSIDVLLFDWLKFMATLLAPLYDMAVNQAIMLLWMPVIIAVLYGIAQSLDRWQSHPRELYVSREGLSGILRKKRQFSAGWQELTLVEQRTGLNGKQDWLLVVRCPDRQKLRIRSRNISSAEDQEMLMIALKENAPHLGIRFHA